MIIMVRIIMIIVMIIVRMILMVINEENVYDDEDGY